nr:hypothetical protein [Tanacetum cinerariifolium]
MIYMYRILPIQLNDLQVQNLSHPVQEVVKGQSSNWTTTTRKRQKRTKERRLLNMLEVELDVNEMDKNSLLKLVDASCADADAFCADANASFLLMHTHLAVDVDASCVDADASPSITYHLQ